MPFTRSVLISAFVASALLGCQKTETPPTPTATVNPPSESVAAPQSTLPPSDASIKPDAPATGASGDGNSPNQASQRELSNAQESTAMPLPGQVNNHSTPPTAGGQK